MKEIVEGGRKRAEVEWAGGLVRFDTDFIDAYDRHGQVIWKTGWADIASAMPGAYSAYSIEIEERSGRVLEAPATPEMSAACHWLLPSDAEVMVPKPINPALRVVPGCGLFVLSGLLGLAWFGSAFVGGSDSHIAVQTSLLALTAGAAGLFVLLTPLKTLQKSRVGTSPPTARDCRRLAGIIDDETHWFQRAEWSGHTHYRLAALLMSAGLFLFAADLASVNPWMKAPMLLVQGAILAGIVALLARSLNGRPPKSTWLTIRGQTVRLLPPDQDGFVDVVMLDDLKGKAGGNWTIFLDDFVLSQGRPLDGDRP